MRWSTCFLQARYKGHKGQMNNLGSIPHPFLRHHCARQAASTLCVDDAQDLCDYTLKWPTGKPVNYTLDCDGGGQWVAMKSKQDSRWAL